MVAPDIIGREIKTDRALGELECLRMRDLDVITMFTRQINFLQYGEHRARGKVAILDHR